MKNAIERALVEAEGMVQDFAADNPGTRVSVLRFANVLGTHLTTPISRNLSRPLCPAFFGFDPLLQFVEEDDVVRALLHVTRGAVPGLYNVAGEGRLPWSEVAAICGTHLFPISPYSPLRIRPVARLFDMPPELEDLLRYGRGVDTLSLRVDRFHLQHDQHGRGPHLHPSPAAPQAVRSRQPLSYTYEHDVATFAGAAVPRRDHDAHQRCGVGQGPGHAVVARLADPRHLSGPSGALEVVGHGPAPRVDGVRFGRHERRRRARSNARASDRARAGCAGPASSGRAR